MVMKQLDPRQPSKPPHRQQTAIKPLAFRPFPGLGSAFLQTIMACFAPIGTPPLSTPLIIPLSDGDSLLCEVSTPPNWKTSDRTIVMVHGLGGNQDSPYMVRLSRKLYAAGYRAVRVNLRACGLGNELAQRPYHGGMSDDIFEVVKVLKQQAPESPITLIGFSLGGNIVLKLAGELGDIANSYLEASIAVCSPVDLANTAALLSSPANLLYNRYYMFTLDQQSQRWTNGKPFSTMYEFDQLVTVPLWGFDGPQDYYNKCSSLPLLPNIAHTCHLIYAADDPFIDHKVCLTARLPDCVHIWLSEYGGHMGFIGWTNDEHRYYWLDQTLIDCINGDLSRANR